MGVWMEECELCGNKTENIFVIDVDGVELRVCTRCAQGKRVIYKKEAGAKAHAGSARNYNPGAHHAAATHGTRAEDSEIVEGYGSIIRNARESMQLPIKVLAEMINEKQSLLLRVEQERTRPSQTLAKKLEKALGIKLERAVDTDKSQIHGKGKESATLGEFVK